MREIDYSSWAEYLLDLFDLYPINIKSILELGAGDCKISAFIHKEYKNYFVSDLSPDMLKKGSRDLIKIGADMKRIPFKSKFDVIFSIFDSVNYLMTEDDFISFLLECKCNLTEDGFITFDVSLEKNSKNNTRRLNRKGQHEGIIYKQKSKFDKKSRIHRNILEISINGEIFTEQHEQMIYEFEEYFIFAEEAGLRVIDCFDCFTFDDAKRNSERVQFVLGKY